MGNSDSQCLNEYYAVFFNKHMRFDGQPADAVPAPKVGGAVVGGYSALEDYGNSVYSKAKEQLIRNIAKDVSQALGMKANYADTAPIRDVVAKLKASIPDPRKSSGKQLRIKVDSNMHKNICLGLAKAINKRYDMNIINIDAEPGDICKKVSEVMYSLFTGLHSEFVTVSGDVTRIVKNLQILKEYVDAANKKILNDLAKNGEDSISTEAQNIKSIYDKLSSEIDRQHAILTNIVDSIIGPLGKSLITMLEDNDSFTGLTEDLKKLLGTSQFSERLGYLLSGTSDIAHAAELVDKALQKIGMSVKEYKNTHGLKDLREKVYQILVKKRPSAAELQKMLVAADVLYRNDLAHQDIASKLESMEKKRGGNSLGDFLDASVAGGANSELDMSLADAADLETFSGENETPFKGRIESYRKSIGKQIREKYLFRKQLFAAFNDQVKNRYNRIKHLLGLIGRKIGSDIKTTPALDLFIKHLNAFAAFQPDRQNIHIALSGFRKDVTSSYIKHKFMESVLLLADVLTDLIKENNISILRDLRNELDDFVRAVDEFNDSFANTLDNIPIDISRPAKVGGDVEEKPEEAEAEAEAEDAVTEEIVEDEDMQLKHEEREDNVAEKKKKKEADEEDREETEVKDDAETPEEAVVGGAMSEALGGVVSNMTESNFSHFKTMKKSIREIDYFYRISGIKQNIQNASTDFKENTENYKNILGEEAGYVIDQIQDKYNLLIRAANQPDAANPALTAEEYAKLYTHGRNANGFTVFQQSLYTDYQTVRAAANEDLKKQLDSAMEGYKFMLEYIKSSQVEMLEAAQALDLYLSSFTNSVQLKADQIKDFAQVLEQIEVVAKWFTDKSGDNLACVFEAFDRALPAVVPNSGANYGAAPAPGAIAAAAVVSHTSPVQDFPISDVKDAKSLLGVHANARNPLNGTYSITKEHYYQEVQNLVAGGANNYNVGRFYLPRILSRDQAINLVKQIEKSLKSIRALENVIATFSKVNVGVSDNVKTFMSSGAMYKAFMKYCVASVISVGYLSLQGAGIAAPVPVGVNNAVPNSCKASDTLLFSDEYKVPGGIPGENSSARSMFAKMGIGLRFHSDTIRWSDHADEKKAQEFENKLQIYYESYLTFRTIIDQAVINGQIGQNAFNNIVRLFGSNIPANLLLQAFQHVADVANFAVAVTIGTCQYAGISGLPAPAAGAPAAPVGIPVAAAAPAGTVPPHASVTTTSANTEAAAIAVAFAAPPGAGVPGFPAGFSAALGVNDNSAKEMVAGVILAILQTDGHAGGNNTRNAFNAMRVPLNDAIGAQDAAAPTYRLGRYVELCNPLKVKDMSIMSQGDVCDRIFEMCLKSMVSKVFTLVGTYSLFNKPAKDQTMSPSLATNPLRQILGGASPGVKIIPEATELYIRLPLLTEWYKKVFEFNEGPVIIDPEHQGDPLVTMIPENDSIWGDLCRIIMLEARNITDGAYPAEYANAIIRAINNIYRAYTAKRKDITCAQILNEFVLDINRRYGFVMRSEVHKYLKEKYKYIDDDEEYKAENRVDYDLLDMDETLGRNPAPSDKFRSKTARVSKREKSLEQFYRAVRKFRQSIEANLVLSNQLEHQADPALRDPDFRTVSEVSLTGLIREMRRKIDNAKTDEDRYRIVHEQLHGIEKFGDIDQHKLLLLHETVIAPMTTLYFTYLLLNDYNKFFVSLNVPVEHTHALYAATTLATGGGVAFANRGAVAQRILAYNNKKFKGERNPYRIPGVEPGVGAAPTGAPNAFDMKLESIYTETEVFEYINQNVDAKFVPRYYMNDAANTTAAHVDNFAEAKQRFMFNNSKLMEEILRKLMNTGLDMNGLTDLYFVGSGSKNNYPAINFDKLEEVCSHMFSNIKDSLRVLRKNIPVNVINRIENATLQQGDDGPERENRISIFYLQEHLFDRLFKNKYGNGLTDANEGLKNLWTVLTKKYDFNGIDNAGAIQRNDARTAGGARVAGRVASAINQDGFKDFFYNSFNDVFSKLGFWDVTMVENRVVEALGLRGLVLNQKSMKFPAAFVPVFRSGQALANPKSKIERESFTDRMPIDITIDAKVGVAPLNEGVVTIMSDANNYNAFLGAHNLYDYDDGMDEEYKYQTINSQFHSNDMQNTASAAAVGGMTHGDLKLQRSLGLIPKLNNLIYKYVSLFMDKGTKKIYRPLLEKFVNGHNAKDILQGKNINDRPLMECKYNAGAPVFAGTAVTFLAGTTHIDQTANNLQRIVSAVCQTEPQPGASIFASLAGALRGIMHSQMDRVTGNFPLYLEDNFANVTEFQKELMRAYLPAFEKELNLLVKKAEFLRTCVEETQVRLYRWVFRSQDFLTPIEFNNGDPSYTQSNILPSGDAEKNTNAARKAYLIGIYDEVIMTARSLLRCVDDVQKELADIPLFFETYQQSIVDYNNRNGHLPFMPISHVTHLMNMGIFRMPAYDENVAPAGPPIFNIALIPNVNLGVGSSYFKFTYGTRGLLHYKQKISLDFAPGAVALLDAYNNKVGGVAGFDKVLMTETSSDMIQLSRWVLDTMYHKQALGAHQWMYLRNLVLKNQQTVQNAIHNNPPRNDLVQNLACQTRKNANPLSEDAAYWGNTDNMINMAENDNFRQTIYRFVSGLYSGADNKLYGRERSNYRIYNILDMNIVPINIHALQREIPFVNLFNYSYTFDHMVKEFIGQSLKRQPLRNIGGNEPTDRRNLLNVVDIFNDKAFSNDEYNVTWHPEDTLVRHLIYPLGFRRLREYVNNIARIMVGNTSLSLNRPKFLSDQLWNKVLLNSIYSTDVNPRDLNDARRLNAARPVLQLANENNRRLVPSVYTRVAYYPNILVENDLYEPLLTGINLDRRSNQNIANSITRVFSFMTKTGQLVDLTHVGAAGAVVAANDINQRLGYEGYLRYNSKLVRWVEWIVQIQRVMRLFMRKQLAWSSDVIVENTDAIAEEVTEYKQNDAFKADDFE